MNGWTDGARRAAAVGLVAAERGRGRGASTFIPLGVFAEMGVWYHGGAPILRLLIAIYLSRCDCLAGERRREFEKGEVHGGETHRQYAL